MRVKLPKRFTILIQCVVMSLIFFLLGVSEYMILGFMAGSILAELISGGEKQRICIARAILKDAPVVLLAEVTASVDPDNEKHIQEAINELVRDKTLIVIAHRLSTIKRADQILVIDGGRVVEHGTHDELVAHAGQYTNLWQRRQNANSWRIAKYPQ